MRASLKRLAMTEIVCNKLIAVANGAVIDLTEVVTCTYAAN
jgi:hypothetical protein